VVDDDATFRGLARRLLAAHGLVVVAEAGSVAEALSSAAEAKPAAALADVELPDGDGFELAGRLTALPWRPRVVVTSVQSNGNFGAEARRRGAEAFVLKADLPKAPLVTWLAADQQPPPPSGRLAAMTAPLRVAIGEDDVLLREGIARVLASAGFEVIAEAGDAEDLLRKGLAHRPDLLVADINMPPGHGDDGLVAAIEVRRQRPETGVLVLSQYYEERYAAELMADGADGVGYLLKERVGRVEEFVDAAKRVAAGRSAVDPEVVARMLGRRRERPGISELTRRELEVLAAMAEGKSNRGIGEALVISSAAVEKHINRIFSKLGLDPLETEHRRVHAVLTYLRQS
jgi:DNA-binding NarL/FixJ family response regulator